MSMSQMSGKRHEYDPECLSQGVAPEEGEEARAPKVLKGPVHVTRAMREEHEATYAPYRSWCKYCVWARGRNKAHKKKKGNHKDDKNKEAQVPIVSLDYWYMSERDREAKSNPLVVMVNEETNERYARALGQKGICRRNGLVGEI